MLAWLWVPKEGEPSNRQGILKYIPSPYNFTCVFSLLVSMLVAFALFAFLAILFPLLNSKFYCRDCGEMKEGINRGGVTELALLAGYSKHEKTPLFYCEYCLPLFCRRFDARRPDVTFILPTQFFYLSNQYFNFFYYL